MFANAGAHGYYRTAYPPDMLRAIAPRVATDLSAPERLSLLDDEWALVRAGRHTAADYLTLAAGYGREHISGVLAEVARRFAAIDEELTTDAIEAANSKRSSRSLLRPLFDELGFAGSRQSTDERRIAARGAGRRTRHVRATIPTSSPSRRAGARSRA